LRRRLQPAAIFVASLLAHAALVALWIVARPPELFVEPPAMQVTLVAPPRPPPPPPARRERRAPPVAPAAAPSPREPPVQPPPPAAAQAPRPPSDEELLAGRTTTVGQLRAAQNRGERGAGKLPPPCKPMSEHSDRQAPPCRVAGPDDVASRVLADGGSAAAGFALEARRKTAIHDYVESQSPPGVADPRQHPGLRCVFLHRHC
jgi:hypothetical protein